MRKTAIASWLLLPVAITVFVSDTTKSGYFEFTTLQDIQKLIPNTVPPQFAEILKGNDKDCLTIPNQTKPLSTTQIKTLRHLADKDKVANLLGNAYCQTATGFKYLMESRKEIQVTFDGVLDYDFSKDSQQSLINKGRTPRATDGIVDQSLQRGLSSQSPSTKSESTKVR
jgi:hypothetical protein